MKRRTRKKSRQALNKYDLYQRAVQSPESDVEWLQRFYHDTRGTKAHLLREDFCGTGLLVAHWVKANKRNRAVGIDIDPEPMEYGRANYLDRLPKDQRRRVTLQEKNVLDSRLPKADIVAAQNFSYFIFKRHAELLRYFKNVHASLKKNGVFVLDAFGGKQCQDTSVDVHQENGFVYYWEQSKFDPVTHDAEFQIHFKVGKKKHERVFVYQWRLWSIPELRDVLSQAGFRRTHVYWEGSNRKGEGNGEFTRTESGEACESWIAYLVAEK